MSFPSCLSSIVNWRLSIIYFSHREGEKKLPVALPSLGIGWSQIAFPLEMGFFLGGNFSVARTEISLLCLGWYFCNLCFLCLYERYRGKDTLKRKEVHYLAQILRYGGERERKLLHSQGTSTNFAACGGHLICRGISWRADCISEHV